ncbi:universal stress protein [Nitrosospira briensis]|uniref:Universal stress protein n=1 Tax=Nitrosospira briensis TaxID=35799 RepID=A0A1I4XDX1_9PROT|nr:universal stress protein [Nitrosospira briensis]SFN24121.1 Nucleotide-binding universal stress protein, UspA family [Nitrosospira briensis]SFN98306.1 Nucleotide-binding universal stress protein, UspA family [Nitrosospira briensis]
MYQRILVPVDGSPTSERALQEALRLAQQQSGRLELVHVLGDVRLMEASSYINYAEMKDAMASAGKKLLEQTRMVAQQSGTAAEVKLLEAGGARIASAIVEEARQWQADLIVIGTHGRTGFSRVLFGSVAEGVVRTAQIPVLLIR